MTYFDALKAQRSASAKKGWVTRRQKERDQRAALREAIGHAPHPAFTGEANWVRDHLWSE